MKKKVPSFLLGLVFLMGLAIFLYPTIADQWNSLHQSRAIASYQEIVENMTEIDFEQQWALARSYNDGLKINTFDGDAFSQEEKNLRGTEYWSVLNIVDNGIMGYISIPKIKQKFSIYHGTSDPVLQVGAGHILGTKLPIGGEGSHSVIAAHRGLPSAKLFSDADKLKSGDKFYIHVLDEVLAYEVDEILSMVDKEDMETLTSAMQNVEGQDYITLFTCTPYGVNSHRLLVRGHRVEYHGEDDETENDNSMVQSIQEYYMLYAILIVAVTALLIVTVRLVRKRKLRAKDSPRREKNEKDNG